MLVRTRRPKNAASKRTAEKRSARMVENPKTTMFIKTHASNGLVANLIDDLYSLKKPRAVMYGEKNTLLPFQDASSIEFLSKRADCSLFCTGYNTLKRPTTLCMGRLFDYTILDMIELQVESYRSVAELKGKKCGIGQPPLVVFQGELFDQSDTHRKLRSLILDLFRGDCPKINLAAIEHCVSLTAAEDGKIHFRTFSVSLTRSGNAPKVDLTPLGPDFTFNVRRTLFSSESVEEQAYKRPKLGPAGKTKNVTRDPLGNVCGRVHNPRQDLSSLQTRKIKALK